MTRDFIDHLVKTDVHIFSVTRAGRTYYINLNHDDIDWSNYSNFYLYSGYYNCLEANNMVEYNYNLEGLAQHCSFLTIEKHNSLKSANTSRRNKPKINKSKVVKEIKEDKYGTNLVLELRNQEIYLSNALLSYLDLKDGSKVNFASDDETNQNYLYIETEENEGYEIKENIIVCPHNVILFKTLFGTDVLYLDIREENLAEEPSYVFYPISENNPQEIESKFEIKSKPSYSNWYKEQIQEEKLTYFDSGNITLTNVSTVGSKSSPVVEKVSSSQVDEIHDQIDSL